MVGYSTITTREEFECLFSHVDTTEVENDINTSLWIPSHPQPDRQVGPSELFLQLLERLSLFWNRNKEATTRTFIDQVILDVLWVAKILNGI
jgi:hypothetical protein